MTFGISCPRKRINPKFRFTSLSQISGKSSLVQGGLSPTISQPGVAENVGLWRWCALRPSDVTGDLLDGPAHILLGETALPELAAANWDRTKLAEQFRRSPQLAVQPIEQSLAMAIEKGTLSIKSNACYRFR